MLPWRFWRPYLSDCMHRTLAILRNHCRDLKKFSEWLSSPTVYWVYTVYIHSMNFIVLLGKIYVRSSYWGVLTEDSPVRNISLWRLVSDNQTRSDSGRSLLCSWGLLSSIVCLFVRLSSPRSPAQTQKFLCQNKTLKAEFPLVLLFKFRIPIMFSGSYVSSPPPQISMP